jgi:hypothetical protein
MDIGRSHLGLLDKSAAFVRRQMRLVAEMSHLPLHRHPRVQIARVHTAVSAGRTLDRSLDQRRVHQRPALDYEAERIKLTVRLRKQHRRKAELSIVWRNRQIEAWPCVLASKGKP